MVPQIGLVINIFQNIYICVQGSVNDDRILSIPLSDFCVCAFSFWIKNTKDIS